MQNGKTDDAIAHNALYGLAFLASDSAAMAQQQRWFAGQPAYENYGLALAADTAAYTGRVSEARTLNHKAVDSAIKADNKENGAVYLANAAVQEAAYGFMQLARQSAAAALKLAPASPGATVESALALAMAGDTAQAESLVADINRRYPVDARCSKYGFRLFARSWRWAGKTPRMLWTECSLIMIQYGLIDFVNNISCLYPTYIRGQAYLAGGKGQSAAGEFQKILDHSGAGVELLDRSTGALGVARANDLEAKSLEGADADAARVRALAAYKTFLELWKDAEPGIPIYKEARVEYARLLNP